MGVFPSFFVLLLGTGVVYYVAEKRGHNASLWAFFSTLVAIVASSVISVMLLGALEEGRSLLVVVVSIVVIPLAIPACFVVLAMRIPAGRGTTRASSWPLTLLGDSSHAGECVLSLGTDGLSIETAGQTARDLVSDRVQDVHADGECLVVVWAEDVDVQRLLFMPPTAKHRTREQRMRFASAIANRINERL